MIRHIEEKNLEQIVRVIHDSFLTVAEEFGITQENAPRYVAFATTVQRLRWQLSEEKRPMFAFFEGEDIIGYYSLQLQDGGCELNNLCVLPAHRRRGIGRELLLDAFSAAKELNCSKMHIGIVEENTVLKDWYRSFGFVHTGTEKFDCFPFTCGYMEKEL